MNPIEGDLKELLESGVGTYVGAGTPAAGPRVTRGWGLRVLPGGRLVDVFLEDPGGNDVLAAAREDGRVAVVVAAPTTYRSIQLKGRLVDVAPPEPGDAEWVQRHRDLYAAATALIGLAPHVSRNLWTHPVMRLRFSVEEGFDQTPGPRAGERL